ncbi:MAG: gamma-glutamyltransferase family protein [Gammaproteobacteria bacterium]
MLHAVLGFEGALSAPHHAAALAGRDVLQEGGTAIEAMVAAAATIAVVYPHMNGIGGDGFWLIKRPGAAPVGIFAGGQAATLATPGWYAAQGHETAIPGRGGLAALTVPGTIGGWQCALDQSRSTLPLSRLLAPAIAHAERGIAVTGNQSHVTSEKLDGLRDVPGFADTFLINGAPPAPGARLRQPALAVTFRHLAENGLRSFYDGDIAETHGAFLASHGSPLRQADFAAYGAEVVEPLRLQTSHGTLYNMIAPTQGVASLMILGIFDRLGVREADGFAHVHGLIESTKQAFRLRERLVRDPQDMPVLKLDQALSSEALAQLASQIDMTSAMPWSGAGDMSDTTWFGAIDNEGRAVSCIQSLYHEFGSGVVLPQSGICWQNRGSSFSLEPAHPRALKPGRLPFHTLCPSLVRFDDGRHMVLGTMGGDGQPQTQSCVFTRYAWFNRPLQDCISLPRWVVGRTWGQDSNTLKLEARFAPEVMTALRERGHDVEVLADYDEVMGHAGALVHRPDGVIEAAYDPRSDGAALGY